MGTDKPFLLVQLSDLHVGAAWAPVDPLARFRACVETIRQSPARPDAVIISGDLADHGSVEEYAQVRQEVATLGVPVHVVPGNHDDRRTLRACFGLPGEGAAPIHYTADVGPLRLVMLDSTVPGEDRGELGREQLSWLKATLTAAPQRATLLVMHHPPLHTGMTMFDSVGLSDSTRLELGRILSQHCQVRAVVSGHLHRAIAAHIGGGLALTAPSTYVQARLDPAANGFPLAEGEPPAFAVHALLGDDLISHTQLVLPSASHARG